jgi:hypothetical protein
MNIIIELKYNFIQPVLKLYSLEHFFPVFMFLTNNKLENKPMPIVGKYDEK